MKKQYIKSTIIGMMSILASSTSLALDGVPGLVVPDASASIGSYTHLKYPSWGQRTHFGIDILANEGSSIQSMAGGVVEDIVDANDANFNSLGYAVIIKHQNIGKNNQDIYSLYLHMRDNPLVNEGDFVYSGQQIGFIGTTGSANNIPHTHFEIRYFSSRFSSYNNIYATGDVRNSTYAKNNWEDPEKLNIGWKWHGNGSIISHGSGNNTCWGCDKDEARIHRESEKGYMPEVSFQWQGSDRCRSLSLEEANGDSLRARVFLKPWELSYANCSSPNCLETNITLPYTIRNTYAPSNGSYKLVNIQFHQEPSSTKRIIARCQ